jgi:hypothetical protein
MTKHKGTKPPPEEPSGKPKVCIPLFLGLKTGAEMNCQTHAALLHCCLEMSQPAEAVAPLGEDKKKKQAEHHDHGHKGDAHHPHAHHHPEAKKDSRDDHFAETMLEMDKKKKHTSKRHA